MVESNSDFNAKLENLQYSGSYDGVIHGAAADWQEGLAVFASKVAGASGCYNVVVTGPEGFVFLGRPIYYAELAK